MAHTLDSSTWEVEAHRSLTSKLAWSTECVLGQPVLHRETLCRKQQQQQRTAVILSLAMSKHCYSRGHLRSGRLLELTSFNWNSILWAVSHCFSRQPWA